MSMPFTLTVPAEAKYRPLVPEVARKYVELSGGSPADAQALAAAVGEAVDGLVNGAGSGASVALEFRLAAAGLEITVRCDGRSAVVKHPLPTRTPR